MITTRPQPQVPPQEAKPLTDDELFQLIMRAPSPVDIYYFEIEND